MQISIIVPVYNKENFIKQCLDSLKAQTFRDLEILLVDDGSTDASGRMCDEYAQKYGASEKFTVRVIHKENGGLVSAWKRGLSEAAGDYAAFVDCDDWIDADFCEKLAAHTMGRDDEIILSDYVIERSSGRQTYVYQSMEPGEYEGDAVRSEVFPKLFGLEDRAVGRSRCMKLFSMKLAKNNMRYGDEKLRFGEDTSLTIPCVLDAGRLYFCDHEAMYHYRYVTDSMVHEYDRTLLQSIQLVKQITEKAIRDKFAEKDRLCTKLLNMADREYIYLLMYAVKNEAGGDRADYIRRIGSICSDPENSRLIRECPVEVSHKANRLIYRCMTDPTALNCRLLRAALRLNDLRG